MINVLDIQKHIDDVKPWPLLVKVGKLSSTLSAIKAIKNRNEGKKICIAVDSGYVDMLELSSNNLCFMPVSLLLGPLDDVISRARKFDILIVAAKDKLAALDVQLTDLTLNSKMSVLVLER